MQTTLIHGEVYERPRWRWITACLFLLLITVISLWKTDWIGVILLLLFVGLYARYEWKMHKEHYVLDISEAGIQVGTKLFAWDELEGYSIGYKLGTQELYTLFLYQVDDDVKIFTFHGPQEEIKEIAEILAAMIPLVSPPRLSGARKLSRILRI